jgi:hypothetical protein
MTEHRTDLHPTDEPDGATAYEASLRAPGHSVTPGDAAPQGAPDDDFEDAGTDDPGTTEVDRAGYDADAVSGDTPADRPR